MVIESQRTHPEMNLKKPDRQLEFQQPVAVVARYSVVSLPIMLVWLA